MIKYSTFLSLYDYIVILLSVLITVGMYKYTKYLKAQDTSAAEYLLLGRRLTLPIFVATLVSTWYAGVIGVTQISYEKGVYNFITQGVFWYVAAIIFALYFLNKSMALNVLSLPDIIAKNFGKKSAKLSALLLYIKVLPIPYAMALGIFISGFSPIDLNIAILIGTLLVTIHCINSGMRGVVAIDICQFVFMFVAIISLIVVSYNVFGGYEYLIVSLPADHLKISSNEKISTFLIWFFIAINTTLLSPVFYQKCFSAKNIKTAKVGIFISICFWVVCDISTTLGGLYAKAHMPNLPSKDAYIIYALNILPDGIKGLFIGGMFFTVISALDSFLFIAGTVLSYDFFKTDSQFTRKLTIIFSAIMTVILSLFFDGKIEKAWMIMESFFIAAMFFPLIIGFVRPQLLSDGECFSTIIITVIAILIWQLCGMSQVLEIFYFGLIVSVALITIVSIFKQKHLCTIIPINDMINKILRV